jgi:hypothetical protein
MVSENEYATPDNIERVMLYGFLAGAPVQETFHSEN